MKYGRKIFADSGSRCQKLAKVRCPLGPSSHPATPHPSDRLPTRSAEWDLMPRRRREGVVSILTPHALLGRIVGLGHLAAPLAAVVLAGPRAGAGATPAWGSASPPARPLALTARALAP